ncbi:MAG: hypothetical protein AAF962_00855 [Actinomycetota bacterium]
MRLRPRRVPTLVGVMAALALAVAACGSGATDDADTAAEATTAPANTPSAADTTDEAAEPVGPEVPAPAENLFAPVDVVNIADGSTLNLAEELAGDDRPVLLWFWAPH